VVSNRWGRDGDISSLSSMLSGIAGRVGMPLPPGAEEAWARAVGENIARHSRPVALRDGLLRVDVDAKAWMTMLDELESTLPGRLSREGLEVERLEFRCAPG